METTCPACGSDTLVKKTREIKIPLEFGRDITVEESIYICQVCGTDGDFADENDKKIGDALEAAKRKLTEQILDTLVGKGISMAYFERAMGLPARTLARWKQGNISASGFALIKTVETYPWLLEVADERFERGFAVKTLINKAAEAFQSAVEPHVVRCEKMVATDGHTATINLSLTLSKDPIYRPIINTSGVAACK